MYGCEGWTVKKAERRRMGVSRQEHWSGLLCPHPGLTPVPFTYTLFQLCCLHGLSIHFFSTFWVFPSLQDSMWAPRLLWSCVWLLQSVSIPVSLKYEICRCYFILLLSGLISAHEERRKKVLWFVFLIISIPEFWKATVLGVAKVGHDLGFKEASPFPTYLFSGLEDLVFLSCKNWHRSYNRER